jgi:hypothetical protein
VNVETGEFRALSDEAARTGEYRRDVRLLIRTLAAEIGVAVDGPLAADSVVRYPADTIVDQGETIRQLRGRELRASFGIPAGKIGGRQFRVIEGGAQ